MTPRENTDNLLRKRPAQRVGLLDSPWGDTLRKWVTQGYPTHKVKHKEKKKVVEDGKEVEREVEVEKDDPVSPARHFGYDMVGAGGWFDMFPHRGFSQVVEETGEWVVKKNGAGACLKWWKNKSGTPEHVSFSMTSREIWDRDYRKHLLATDRERVNIKGAKEGLDTWRKEGRWAFYGHLFIWEQMRASLGDLTLYESLVADPGWIHDIGRVYTDFYKAHYKLLFDEAGVPDGIWVYEDLGYKHKLFASPKVLRELIFPYYKEVVDFFHSYDLPVVLHTCGYTRDAIPLVIEAGFDALNPMEIKAGNDPLEYAEKHGDKLAFVGGLDARILESHDRALIRKGVADLVEGMKARGARFVFASDHSLSTNIDYRDYQYAVEVYREHAAY